MPQYVRDGRAPVPKSEAVSRVMSANKDRDTGPELLLRKSLREAGIPGYRLHWKKVPGRPDIAYPGKKLAVFVHGCFWHRCPLCSPSMPKTHSDFWKQKFARNKERDARKLRDLGSAGWEAIVLWECEIREDPLECAKRVKRCLERKTKRGDRR